MARNRGYSGVGIKRTLLAISVGVFSNVGMAEVVDSDPMAKIAENEGDEQWRAAVKDADKTLRGETVSITSTDGQFSYSLRERSTLNALKGSRLKDVNISQSHFNAEGSEIEGRVFVSSGEANIRSSKIENGSGAAFNLPLLESDPLAISQMRIYDSEVTGSDDGGVVGATSELWVTSSVVRGLGNSTQNFDFSGLRLHGGVVHLAGNTSVSGKDNGVYIANGSTGNATQLNFLEINDSSISGTSGAAIKIDQPASTRHPDTIARILVANGSSLFAGNGRLIDVLTRSIADFEVDNSQLKGDLVADDTSTLNVALRNHARLDGNIVNGNAVVIDSSGHWQLAGDNSVKSLAIDGGSVGFSEDANHTLSLGQLSGRGRFDMRINLDNGTGDLLNVTGNASGNHLLNIRNTGEEAVPAEFEALRVVHTESGDAQFRLRGVRVDLGAYSYALEQQGTDWFIVGSGKTISPSTQSALALFSAGPTIWNSELSTLRSRMGEVRGREEGGGWLRSYGNRFNASLDAGVKYRQKQQGLSFGADAPVPVSDGHLLVGVMGGYSQSDLDMDRGTSGEVDSYYLGAYGTWLSEEGYYLDGVVKVNKFHNQSKVAMSDGEKAKGDYNNMAVGGSVEFGKHVKLPDDYFVEPFAQLSSVWVDGNRYTLDNGLQAKTSQTQSVLGKVGATVGRQFALKDGGVVQPYVRVAGAHEFSRSNDVSVNGQRFDSDVFGSRFELGTGVSVSLSERLQVHADFDYMKGEHVEQPWGANVGVRLAF